MTYRTKYILAFIVVMTVIACVTALALTGIHVAQQNGDRDRGQNQQFRIVCTQAGGTYIEQNYNKPLCVYPSAR